MMEIISKLVELYFNTNLKDVPKYLLENKDFMIKRVTLKYKNGNHNFDDIYHSFNPFKYDIDFIIEFFHKMNIGDSYSKYNILKNVYKDVLYHNEEFLYKFSIKFPHIYFYIQQDIESGKYNLSPKLFLLFSDTNFIKFALKSFHNFYIKFNSSSFLLMIENIKGKIKILSSLNDKDIIFNIIKHNILYYDIQNFITNDKIYNNLLLKYHCSSLLYNDEPYNYLKLFEYFKKMKQKINIGIKANNILAKFNLHFLNYCIEKYGLLFEDKELYYVVNVKILKKVNKFIHPSRVRLDTYFNLSYNPNNMDKVFILSNIRKNLYFNTKKLIPYYFKSNKIFERLILCNNFIFLKLVLKRIHDLKFFFNKNEHHTSFYKNTFPNNVEIIYKFIETCDYELGLIHKNFLHNKKNIEKICYYYPNKKFLLYSGRINIDCIHSSKFVKKDKYSFFHLQRKNDKNEILKFMKETKIDILKLNHHLKNDDDIVYESLKNNEKMIYFSNVNHINEYVNNNFDINKTLEKLKK